jgi:hypothetical protein
LQSNCRRLAFSTSSLSIENVDVVVVFVAVVDVVVDLFFDDINN